MLAWILGLVGLATAGFFTYRAASGALSASGDTRSRGELDPWPPHDAETDVDPTEKPGPRALRAYVLDRWGGYDAGILGDASHQSRASAHNSGRAWDWGTPAGQVRGNRGADVDGFFAWLFANGSEMIRRLGITYVIWQRRIWSTGTREWKPYGGADPHTTHVHLSFGWPGARGETSAYTTGLVPLVDPPPAHTSSSSSSSSTTTPKEPTS